MLPLWFQHTDFLSLVYPDSCTISCKVNTPRQTLRPPSLREEMGRGDLGLLDSLAACSSEKEARSSTVPCSSSARLSTRRCKVALCTSVRTVLPASGISLVKHWTENNGICLLFAVFPLLWQKDLEKIPPALISPRLKRGPGGICAHPRRAPPAPRPSPALGCERRSPRWLGGSRHTRVPRPLRSRAVPAAIPAAPAAASPDPPRTCGAPQPAPLPPPLPPQQSPGFIAAGSAGHRTGAPAPGASSGAGASSYRACSVAGGQAVTRLLLWDPPPL